MFRELNELRQMWARLRWSREQMLAYRDRQLRLVIAHAYENVPHYRRLFDGAGVSPRDIRSVADLSRLPMTTRYHVQESPPQDLVARGVDPARLIVRMSGGSTGEPKCIRRSWLEERLLNAFRFRARRCLGLRATDVIASVGLVRSRQAADRQLVSRLLHRVGLFRERKVSCLLPVEQVVHRLAQLQPDVITGYAGAVALAAEYVLEHGRGGGPAIRPRLVTTGAEVQTPLMRRQIAEAFGAPVYNVYGAHEVNLLAWECPKTGQLHTCDDLVIVEVLRPDGAPVAPGERGEVVITALHSYAMPFIRYRLDDVVTLGSDACACGMPFGTIRHVHGRMVDYFPLPDGRLLHPFDLIDKVLHDRAAWARRYQVVQHRRDLIVLRAVARCVPSQERLDEIRRESAAVLGPGVELRIEFVDEIATERNGKFRTARSLVQSRYEREVNWDELEHAR